MAESLWLLESFYWDADTEIRRFEFAGIFSDIEIAKREAERVTDRFSKWVVHDEETGDLWADVPSQIITDQFVDGWMISLREINCTYYGALNSRRPGSLING